MRALTGLEVGQNPIVNGQVERIVYDGHQPYGEERRCLLVVAGATAFRPRLPLLRRCQVLTRKRDVLSQPEPIDHRVRPHHDKHRSPRRMKHNEERDEVSARVNDGGKPPLDLVVGHPRRLQNVVPEEMA